MIVSMAQRGRDDVRADRPFREGSIAAHGSRDATAHAAGGAPAFVERRPESRFRKIAAFHEAWIRGQPRRRCSRAQRARFDEWPRQRVAHFAS
jgi:hypothetical protein